MLDVSGQNVDENGQCVVELQLLVIQRQNEQNWARQKAFPFEENVGPQKQSQWDRVVPEHFYYFSFIIF